MISLRLSDFPPPFNHLNGARHLRISRLDLFRSITTLGYRRNTQAFSLKRLFRLLEFFGLVYDSVEVSSPSGFKLSQAFWSRAQSDKVSASYQIGMGLTKFFAESVLEVPWLSHLETLSTYQLDTAPGFQPKRIIHQQASASPAKAPDLVGFAQSGRPVALEAKGYSSGYNIREHQHAINQVSKLLSVNGDSPIVRAACFFNLATTPFEGIIIDPEPTEEGVNYKATINIQDFLKDYYSVFLSDFSAEAAGTATLFGREFQMLPIIPGLLMGVDLKILTAILNNEAKGLTDAVFSNFAEFYGANISESISPSSDIVSLGKDGIVVINLDLLKLSGVPYYSSYSDGKVDIIVERRGA